MTAPLPLTDLRSSPTAFRFEGHRHAGDVDVDVSFFVTNTPPGMGTDLHTHPYAEVFILQAGRARYTVGDEQLDVSPGHVVVVPPETPHGYLNIGDEPLLQVCIHDGGTMSQTELGVGDIKA